MLEEGSNACVMPEPSKRDDNESVPDDSVKAEVVVPLERENLGFPWIDWKVLWMYAGPGWLMSLAYLDPGNLEADLQDGAYTNYALLWVLLLATLMGLVLQILSAKLGVVTGLSLAQGIVKHYNCSTRYFLWIMTEIAIIGSDIQEVLGSAIAWQILTGIPIWAGVLVTSLDTFVFMGLHQLGIRYLEAFILSLLLTMIICFWVNLFEAAPPAGDVVLGIVNFTNMPSYAITIAVGTVGAVIMPHNLYLHSGLVRSRIINRENPEHVRQANKYNRIESTASILMSFLINLAVVAVFAVNFFDITCAEFDAPDAPFCKVPYLTTEEQCADFQWIADTSTCCGNIGLASAGTALYSTMGNAGLYIWAVGLLAAGQASTLTTSLAGQITMEGFLNIRISQWKRIALTRSIALVPSIIVGVAASTSPRLMDTVNSSLNILQSIQLPFALLPVLSLTSRVDFLGRFANGTKTKVICWLMALFLVGINFQAIFSLVEETTLDSVWFLFGAFFTMYCAAILYVISYDINELRVFLGTKLCKK